MELAVAALALLTANTLLPGQTATVPQSPKLDTFGVQLARNFGATFSSQENLLPLAVGAGATGLAAVWDDELQEHFSDSNKGNVVEETGHILGSRMLLGGVSAAVLITGYSSDHDKLRRVGYDLSQSFVLTEGLTQALKFGVGRERPDGADNHSFVSGHSSQSFAMATVVAHHYPKAAIPAYIAAGFVAASRVAKDKHWLSDSIAGSALGFIVASTVIREDRLLSFGRVSFAPRIPPGGGVAITASLRL